MSNVLGIGSRVKHPAYGDGVVIRLHKAAYEVCFMLHGIKQVGRDYDKWQVVEAIPADENVTFNEAEKSLIKVLRNFSDISEEVPIGERWAGGTMILKPSDNSLKEKEFPIETFFHKIVMVRDRLRVMEQRVNASKKLTDAESRSKVGEQQAFQGNLDPCALYASADSIQKATIQMCQAFGAKHIANLGHGVYPDTPLDGVRAFVEAVQSFHYK